MRYLALLVAALAMAGSGCGRSDARPSSPFKPTATFQDIMLAIVDPAADKIWDSVSTEITKKGVEEKQPRTDEEWAELRHQAVALVEAANLLAIEHRPLVAPGKPLDNKAGYLNPQDIQSAIERTRPAFIERVYAFQDAATEALVAIDARRPAAVVEAGAHIQVACEQCHLRYWYPNGGPPPVDDIVGKRPVAAK